MDNKLNEIRRKIKFLRAEMLSAEENIRKQINRDEDCSEAAVHLMSMRVVMLGLIGERNRLGGEERLLNVDERGSSMFARPAGSLRMGRRCFFQRKPLDLIPGGDRLVSRKRVQSKSRSPVPMQSERKRLEAAVSDETILQGLRRRITELDQLVRQLNQPGLDNARAQVMLSRKRAELEDLINRGQRCQHRSDGTTTTRIARHG